MTKRGKIICTKTVSYENVAKFLAGRKTKEAVDSFLKEEQDLWLKKNVNFVKTESKWQTAFFASCFPKWTYILDGTECSSLEARRTTQEGVVWDIELKVEHDPKLIAYKLMKNEKD